MNLVLGACVNIDILFVRLSIRLPQLIRLQHFIGFVFLAAVITIILTVIVVVASAGSFTAALSTLALEAANLTLIEPLPHLPLHQVAEEVNPGHEGGYEHRRRQTRTYHHVPADIQVAVFPLERSVRDIVRKVSLGEQR